jgi:sigma-54 specific flagellar transcriptional regulator A
LGIVGALAAPLGTRRGVLYVDYRDRRRVVDDRHFELFLAAATVFGLLLEGELRTERVRGELSEAKRHAVEARAPVELEDLLGFPSLARLREEIAVGVRSASPMLVLGESGSGKTMLAQAIAEASGRRPVVRVMLGASDDLNTITSELFGHERGAFTGAGAKRVGLVEYASGGTLVLDELLNLPPHAQRLLLDFVQFGTFRPLGYERREPKRADVRIIAATNGDLQAAMREGRLREDLYHRLAHLEVEMPPLRARRADIPLLAERLLRRADRTRRWTLSPELLRVLLSPDLMWSGNLRQLDRVILRARDRATVREPGATTLLPEHLEARDLGERAPEHEAHMDEEAPNVAAKWQRLQASRARLDDDEKDVLREALDASGGVVAHAARDLGVARTTLASRLEAVGLRAPKS